MSLTIENKNMRKFIFTSLLPHICYGSSSAICKCYCEEETKAIHVATCRFCSSSFCALSCPFSSNSSITATCLEKSSEKDRIIIISYLVLTAIVVGYALIKDYLPALFEMMGYHKAEGFEQISGGETIIGTSNDTSRVVVEEELDEVSWSEKDPIVWDEADHLE